MNPTLPFVVRLVLEFTAIFLTSTPAIAAEAPNFVIINIDDLGYADIGPFGSTLNRTPHLDCMAKEGRMLSLSGAES